jgi:predicted small integral membrane protein
MLTRLSKISLVAALGLYLLLVVFNNLTDYGSNYAFVQHVLAMDTTFKGNAGMWRAIHSEPIYHAFYASVIAWEAVTCVLLFAGALRLLCVRTASAQTFNRAKDLCVGGLTLNLLLWLVAFMAVGGEWFMMWQSSAWNGVGTSGRMFTVAALILLFVNSRDEELVAKP